MNVRNKLPFPCTGPVATRGFAEFVAAELGESRRNLQRFEQELRQALTAPLLTLVNSGSSANLAAALLVKQRCAGRRRVLLAGFSFPTTLAAFTITGFEARLVDTEPDGFNLDPIALERAIDGQVAAVVVTHFLGFPAQLGAIAELARAHGAILVQDACETMNLQVEGRSLYTYPGLVTHSFYHPHHLSSFGGGAVVTGDVTLHDQVQSIVHWGRACRCHYDPSRCAAPLGLDHNFWYEREGLNVEMSELNACFARWQLRSWPEQEARRWAHWQIWTEALRDVAGVRTWPAQSNVSPFVFPVGVEPGRLEKVTRQLLAAGVEVRSLMGGAIHRQPAYRHLAHDCLARCEETGARSFFAGLHQTLESKQVCHAARIARTWLQKT